VRQTRKSGGKARQHAPRKSFRDTVDRPVLYRAVFTLSLAGFGILGYLVAPGTSFPQQRSFTIQARQYAYDPPVIRVNRGDTVRLRFVSLDVVHGFYLEGHDIDVRIIPMRSRMELRRPSRPGAPELVEEVALRMDREGKFRYWCSQTCGSLHPFMLGEMIVEPNRLLPTSIGLTVGVLLGGLLMIFMKRGRS